MVSRAASTEVANFVQIEDDRVGNTTELCISIPDMGTRTFSIKLVLNPFYPLSPYFVWPSSFHPLLPFVPPPFSPRNFPPSPILSIGTCCGGGLPDRSLQ
eukprot:TRINITY_DN6015_c0_g2_i6.p1 TRINITY_DN6015_c0_g2~~TRINITY_DN6015_c0_g2_i6.p1  ORF type:complete len:100 (-),score=19.13 TRINITY_DN6015_c0_g2_i6:340-639(-)